MLKVIPGWELDVERGPDCLVVKVRKPRRSGGSLAPLDEELWAILDQHFTYRVVLELDQMKSLNEEILDQLLSLHDRLEAHGGLMRICGLTPRNRRLLLERQANDRLIPYHDLGEAMMGSAAPRRPR
jgi:anti-anti-sigma regulatory factor